MTTANLGRPSLAGVTAQCIRIPGVRIRCLPWLCAAAALTLFVSAQSAQAAVNIVWCDEFNETSLNTNKWTYDTGNGFWVSNPGFWVSGWGNNELEYYTSRTRNVYVTNGLLHIRARRESYHGFSYTSGRIKTLDRFSKCYGRFEFRAKLPTGTGFWPAFWMLPRNSPYGGWPNSGEVDVMENDGSKSNHVSGTIHFGGAGGYDVHFGQIHYFENNGTAADFHTYALEWTTNAMRWYVDGTLYETQTDWWSNIGKSSDRYPYPAPFDQPFYILMNLAIGGNFLDNPSTNQINASLPGEMQVDYIRVYDETPPLAVTVKPQEDGGLLLSWPSNIVCHLQMLADPSGLGTGKGWADVPGAANPYLVPDGPNRSSAFYRLISP